ncbi:membrane protein [Microvirga vignae]|uniref:Membrane protein n=1 Tax=Microvirga vignae TaxID=1225564 RepID=A0A0H1RCN1_9HYPH|nr:ABC transporter permease [Microvirga vignae]KLK92965.1 membrane protein [Microvirga vignae]
MRNILIVARKEIQEGLRNRWVLATTLLLAALALTLTFLGSAPTGNVGVRALDIVIVSLSSLTIFLLPLIALLISHDAIVGEMERGTMLLLLSYPIARWQVVLGKFLGHLAILAFATLLGYGAAAVALAVTGEVIDAESWKAFASMIGSSVLLGAAFIAVGYLVSALVRERGTAAGIAIGIWLVFVLIYDMALLGLLVVDQGQTISGNLLSTLLLLNPTDVYRLFNLSGSGNVSALSGMAGVAQNTALSSSVLLAALAVWALFPLGLATLAFSRREL